MSTKKFTASQLKNAISKANLSPKEEKTAMTLGKFLGPLNTKTGIVVLDLLLGIAPALKDGGKIKRKPASRSKIAKVMKRKKK